MSILRRGFIIAGRHLFYTLSISVILAMLIIAGIVWLSATVSERKDDIAGWVSEQIGYEVTIGSAGLYWLDLFPKLKLDDVAILQDNGQVAMVTADTLRLELDLLATLEQRSPELSAVDVAGLKAEVRRSADNYFSLAGQRPRSFRFEVEDIVQRLDKITIENAVIAYRDAAYPVLNGQYRIHQADVGRVGEDWQSELAVSPPTELADRLELDMRLTLSDTKQLVGAEGELKIQGLALSRLQQLPSKPLPVITDTGQLDIQTQLNWQREHSEAVAEIDVRGLDLRVRESGDSLPIKAFQGDLQWQQQAQKWSVQGQQLQIKSNDRDWPQTNFSAESKATNQWYLEGNYLHLADLQAFAVLFPELPEAVIDLKAAGEIHDYQLAYNQTAGLQSLKASVNKLSTAPFDDFPGVADLSFDIDWQPDHTDLLIHSEDWLLIPDELLRLPETLEFESTTGELEIRREKDSWRASATDLRVLSNDMTLSVDGSLHSVDEQMLADLSLQIDDLAVDRWLNYIPEQVLDPTFLNWSRQAFQAGTVESLSLTLDGDLTEFPFENEQEGIFSAEMQVRDASLQYARNWPALTGMDARITAIENQLQITPSSGQTAGFAFAGVSAVIEQVFDGKPQLSLEAQLDGSTSAALTFLQNSPLQSRFGKVTDWLTAEGTSDINLQLAVPLLSPKETEVSGSVGFDNSQLSLKTTPDAPVEQLTGRLQFNNDGIAADNLQGEFLQRPLSVQIEPTDGSTRIIATGRIPAEQASQLWQGEIPDFINGEAAFESIVNISEVADGEFALAVEVSSDLNGLAVDMPAPLGKSANESRQLNFDVQTNGEQITLSASMADIVRLVHQSGPVNRTVIALGQEDDALPPSGFHVRTDLNELDMDAWQTWYQGRQIETGQQENEFWPNSISAQVDTLTFQDQALEQFSLQAERISDEWLLDLEARQIKGTMRVPMTDSDVVHINLERLNWQLPERGDEVMADQASTSKRASLWPAMDVYIGDLQIDDMNLGTLQLAASREGQSWVLNSASLESAVLQATVEGRWQQFEEEEQSRFSITLNSDDLAGLLSQLQYQPVIDARNAKVDVNIEWPAEPLGFSRTSMVGNMTLSTGRGQLREVEPGTAGRVFGLLSIAAIPRRLSLDFSDLFDDGLAFSSINSRFDFADGIAHTDNLRLQAQSAVINIQGPVNLVEQTYDQTVKITPSVSSTLPLAGAVAGGPVGLGVGTAIMLADRLVGRVFNRDIVDFISYRYRLTGPWNDPEMDLITSNDE